MKIPNFYKCVQCGDIFEAITENVKCPKCGLTDCEKLEGEERLKCLIHSKELLIFQKFHELKKIKTVGIEILEWFKQNLTNLEDDKRPMLALYKLSDLCYERNAPGHVWSWRESRRIQKEENENGRHERILQRYARRKKRTTRTMERIKYGNHCKFRTPLQGSKQRRNSHFYFPKTVRIFPIDGEMEMSRSETCNVGGSESIPQMVAIVSQ